MPATVNQPSTLFSFLPTAASATAESRSSDQGFAQMLQGQMSARANQQSSRSAYASHTENTARSNASQRAHEPQREEARSTERPQRTERKTAANTERCSDGREADTDTADSAAATSTATNNDQNTTATAAATQPAPQQQPATPAEGAALAGVPAAIAALLAGVQTAAGDTATDSGSGLLPADAAGDTPVDSLQNPAGDLTRFAADADAAGRAAQLATQLQGAADNASGGADNHQSGSIQGSQLPGGLHAAAAALAGSRHTAASQPAVPQLPVNTPAGQTAFADDVGDRVMWMLGRAESKAELVLTPPTLGKVEVSINLSGDQTTAQFVASSQAARDALEQALPKLREILQQAGISLGQTSVGTSGDQQAAQDDGGRRGRSGGGGGVEATDSVGTSNWIRQSDGMVDTFV